MLMAMVSLMVVMMLRTTTGRMMPLTLMTVMRDMMALLVAHIDYVCHLSTGLAWIWCCG